MFDDVIRSFSGVFFLAKSLLGLQVLNTFVWAVLSDEQMSNEWPFSLLNDEQMSNKVGVEHQPVIYWAIEPTSFLGFSAAGPELNMESAERTEEQMCDQMSPKNQGPRESFEKLPNHFFCGEQKHNEELVF